MVLTEEQRPREDTSDSNSRTGPNEHHRANIPIGSRDTGKSREAKYLWSTEIYNSYLSLFCCSLVAKMPTILHHHLHSEDIELVLRKTT